MQCLPAERDSATMAVGGIAHQRMAERCEMHADLVRAPGLELACEQRACTESLTYFVVRDGGFARRDDRHRCALHRVTPYRRVDRPAACEIAVRERQVFSAHSARLQL